MVVVVERVLGRQVDGPAVGVAGGVVAALGQVDLAEGVVDRVGVGAQLQRLAGVALGGGELQRRQIDKRPQLVALPEVGPRADGLIDQVEGRLQPAAHECPAGHAVGDGRRQEALDAEQQQAGADAGDGEEGVAPHQAIGDAGHGRRGQQQRPQPFARGEALAALIIEQVDDQTHGDQAGDEGIEAAGGEDVDQQAGDPDGDRDDDRPDEAGAQFAARGTLALCAAGFAHIDLIACLDDSYSKSRLVQYCGFNYNGSSKIMDKQKFLTKLQSESDNFNRAVSTSNGDWVVKGFIDIARNIYTISTDTKVVSKVMELLLFPELVRFAEQNDLKLHLAERQNFYPDVTFIDNENHLFAVDLKTTYRVSDIITNGMTLGAFTGYFRSRESRKNCSFPYGSYEGHFVLGVIYSQALGVDERQVYSLNNLEQITSAISDFQFFVQEKYRIASDLPGSGNTKNIGSIRRVEDLLHGRGPFVELGEAIFDDYWMYYLTEDMARAVELSRRPYMNLKTYRVYKGLS